MPLLDDLVKKLQEATGRVGKGALDSTQREIKANMKLNQLGSLMGSNKEGERETLKSQGPLMSTILSMLDLGGMNPGNSPTGSGQAMISPTMWKGMAPEAKAMLTNVADKAPDVFSKILKAPQDLIAFVLDKANMPVPNALGTLERINPYLNRLSVVPEEANKLSAPIHELQHMLNFGRIGKNSPEDAGTIGLLLKDLLPTGQKSSLNMRTGQLLDSVIDNPTMPRAADMMKPNQWKALDPERKANYTYAMSPKLDLNPNTEAKWSKGMGSYGYQPDQSWINFLQHAMMDEGLAHLSEQTVKPYARPELVDLAHNLGVGTKVKQPSPTKIAEGDPLQELFDAFRKATTSGD